MWDLLGEVENGPGLGPFTDWAWITCTAASHGCHTRTLRLGLLSLLNVSMFCLKKINGPVEPVRLPRDKDTCCTDLTPRVPSQNSHGRRREPTPESCPLTSMYHSTCIHTCALACTKKTNTHTQIVIKQIFKWPWKLRGRERMLIWYFFFLRQVSLPKTGFSV